MAKLTTTDVYGILTAHSNVVIKNDLTVGGILTASSLNASVFTVTSLNLISGIATTGPGLFFKTISAPAPTSTIVSVYDGYFYATKVFNAVWMDIAEFMLRCENSEPGDVIVMTKEGVRKSFKRAQPSVVGVNSDTFGYALGADNQEMKVPIGLIGRVNVKVKEKLEIGDMLVSDIDGFASKAAPYEVTIPGVILGKVLEEKNDTEVSRISMLIINR